MNMFELFKYMNGSFFFKVQVYEWSGFSDFSIQIYIKTTSRYSPTTEACVLNTNFVYFFCMLII